MPLVETSTYLPPLWLSNGHLQTFYAALLRKVRGVHYHRERIDLPDGDFLDLDWLKRGASRLVILCHGLEGDTQQAYILGMVRAFNKKGWDALAWNYRGCGGQPNRLLRSYHSGATEDLHEIIRHAQAQGSYDEIVLIGFSLGGNLVLKYLGEQGSRVNLSVKRAVVFSVPCDLRACSDHLAKFSNKIYMEAFLYRLHQKIKIKMKLFPSQLDNKGYGKIRNFKDFDDRYTSKLHGFQDALDYWKQCSSLGFLKKISIPTLLVNALNDPFLPPACFPIEQAQNHRFLYLETPSSGGHVGFVSFNEEGEYWSEKRALEFIENPTNLSS